MTSPFSHLVKLYQLITLQNHTREMEKLKVSAPKRVRLGIGAAGHCLVCQGSDGLQLLRQDCAEDGADMEAEDYNEMLSKCYNIEIIDDERYGEICETCILRLRDAITFRAQVEAADEALRDDICEDTQEVQNIEKKSYRTIFTSSMLKKPLMPPKLKKDVTVCPVCNEESISHFHLRRHYMTHFHNHICHICGKGFFLEKGLKSHMDQHSGTRYICHLCPRDYISKGALHHHIATVHKKIKMYPCHHCPEKYSSSTSRLKHMFEVHNVPCRRFACTDCGQIFFTMQRHNVHVKRKHLQIKEQNCNICPFTAVSTSELNRHKMKHCDIRNFNCSECGKSFKAERTLREHAKLHSNIREYHCPHCEATYAQRAGLTGHIRKCHQSGKPSRQTLPSFLFL